MPVVSNVRATQRPGTKLVDIYYDVTGTTNSVIQVSVAVSTNGGQIAWGSVTNKYYTVQRSPALGGTAAFVNIAEHLPSTPPENLYLDTSATNRAAFFYRVCVE